MLALIVVVWFGVEADRGMEVDQPAPLPLRNFDVGQPHLSTIARESVIAAITTDPPSDELERNGLVTTAVALRALLPRTTALTTPERALLADWLDRIATTG